MNFRIRNPWMPASIAGVLALSGLWGFRAGLIPLYPRYNKNHAAAQIPAAAPGALLRGFAGKPLRKADEAQLASIQAALQTAYGRNLRAGMEELSKAFRRQAGTAPAQTQAAVKAFAGMLRRFRDRKLAAYRKELAFEFQRKMKNRTGLLQEDFLDFEKRMMAENQPRKLNLQLELSVASASKAAALNAELQKIETREEARGKSARETLRKELESYRNFELASLARSLENQARRLDRQILDKTAKYARQMTRASREALEDEQAGFKRERRRYSGPMTGPEKPEELRILALRGHSLLETGLQDDRRRVETLLCLKAATAQQMIKQER